MASNIRPVTSLPCSALFSVKVRTSRVRSITNSSRALVRETSIDLEDTTTRYTRDQACVNGWRTRVVGPFERIPFYKSLFLSPLLLSFNKLAIQKKSTATAIREGIVLWR